MAPDLLVRDSATMCAITHFDPLCRWASVTLAATVAGLLLDESPLRLDDLASALAGDGAPDEIVGVVRMAAVADIDGLQLATRPRGHVLRTLGAGLWASVVPADFESGLIAIVSEGGDADTNGAVAGAVAGAWFGAAVIPERWLESVPEMPRIRALAQRLRAQSATQQ